MNLPNLISLSRILMVPVIVWLITENLYVFAFGVFVLAGVSDGIDGFIAKRFNQKTVLGAYLDALADKMLLVSIFLVLGFIGEIPSWLVIAVVTRDLLIVAALVLSRLLDRPMAIEPHLVSKMNTVAQIMLAALALADLSFPLALAEMREAFHWITGTLTGASALVYLAAWLAHMKGAAKVAEEKLAKLEVPETDDAELSTQVSAGSAQSDASTTTAQDDNAVVRITDRRKS